MKTGLRLLALAFLAGSLMGCTQYYKDDRSCIKVVTDALGEPNRFSVTAGKDSGLGIYVWERPSETYFLYIFKGPFGWYLDNLHIRSGTDEKNRADEIEGGRDIEKWSLEYRANQ